MGDCWFSRSLTGRKDIPFDVTLCLVHTEAGKKLLRNSELCFIEVDQEKAVKCNGGMIYSCEKPHPGRKQFFSDLGIADFPALAEMYFPVVQKRESGRMKRVKALLKSVPGFYEWYYFIKKEKEFQQRCQRQIPDEAMRNINFSLR